MHKGSHPESGLEKSVWSDADFERMGWHDVTAHGLHVRDTGDVLPRLLLDIDYIVGWVHPVPPRTRFSFWTAPATLAFDDVWDLEGDLGFKGMSPNLMIDGIHRLAPDDGRDDIPLWHIEGHHFDLTFRASGYRQHIRQEPRLASRLALSHDERGGCRFDETAWGGH